MPIDRADIERVKQQIDIVAFIRSRGVRLTRKGRQFVGLCPFHDDREPSLVVDSIKQLWNCLGRCKSGGDVYRFVMKFDSIDFKAAHQVLMKEANAREEAKQMAKPKLVAKKQRAEQTEREVKQETKRETKATLSVVECDWLERVTTHYHASLLQILRAT